MTRYIGNTGRYERIPDALMRPRTATESSPQSEPQPQHASSTQPHTAPAPQPRSASEPAQPTPTQFRVTPEPQQSTPQPQSRTTAEPQPQSSPPPTSPRGGGLGGIIGKLLGGEGVSAFALPSAETLNLPFGLELADVALALLFLFLYLESGDAEFLIILACFAIGTLGGK